MLRFLFLAVKFVIFSHSGRFIVYKVTGRESEYTKQIVKIIVVICFFFVA